MPDWPEWKEEIRRQLRSLNLAPPREAEIAEELAQHLEDRYQASITDGATADEARRVALEELCDGDFLTRELRPIEQGRLQEPAAPGYTAAHSVLVSLWQDARFGVRTIFKDRGFAVAAVLALALGIGSCTAIFSVIYNVLLNPFPYLDSHHICQIRIHDSATAETEGRNYFPVPEFLDYQEQNHVFDRTMGVWEETVLMGSSGALEPFDTDRVTGNAFEFLGVAPLAGRAVLPSDALPGAPPVFVLSYKVWVKRFGMDRSIVGKTFILNGQPTTLVGIMPRRFAFWGGDIWIPASLDRADPSASQRYFVLYGRLKPGLNRRAAEAEMKILAERF